MNERPSFAIARSERSKAVCTAPVINFTISWMELRWCYPSIRTPEIVSSLGM